MIYRLIQWFDRHFCQPFSKNSTKYQEREELSEHEKYILSQMVNSDAKTIEKIGLMYQKQLAGIYQHCGRQKIEPQESEDKE